MKRLLILASLLAATSMVNAEDTNPLLTRNLSELNAVFDNRDGRICGSYRTSVQKGNPDTRRGQACAEYAKKLGLTVETLTDDAAWNRYLSLSKEARCTELVKQGSNANYLASQGCKAEGK
ncbi:MAG TPA: hypothetical protein PK031_03365 [Pseudomonadales bacterium]|nr:hypothetical protein [Pseudomonadales bacterium]